MLVSEIKKELEKYDRKELTNIIVELYKRIPKKKKEEHNIDEFIKNMKVKEVNKNTHLTFEELKIEILFFLDCVDNEYYSEENKVINKNERRNWRFKVKSYYKELNSVLPSSSEGSIASELLIEIFKRLSRGSNYLLFANWETFRAVGISQEEYYDVLMNRILSNGYTKENIENCIGLLDVPKDPTELSYDMFKKFAFNVNLINMNEIALELLKEKVNVLEDSLKTTKNSHTRFELKEDINDYIKCILEIYSNLKQYELGIKYFHKHYIEDNKEVKEYILLDRLEKLELKDEWLKEYESNKGRIKYRDSINEKYREFKNK